MLVTVADTPEDRQATVAAKLVSIRQEWRKREGEKLAKIDRMPSTSIVCARRSSSTSSVLPAPKIDESGTVSSLRTGGRARSVEAGERG